MENSKSRGKKRKGHRQDARFRGDTCRRNEKLPAKFHRGPGSRQYPCLAPTAP